MTTRAPNPEPSLPLLHELVESQAGRTPGAVAVAAGGERLSYSQLDRRAAQLADRLCAAGVGPERIVAVCVARSSGLVTAVLGVLKSGGAYLPLDPAYPAERLRFMLADTDAQVVVGDRLSLAALGNVPVAHTILIDDLCDSPQRSLPPTPTPDALAPRPPAGGRMASSPVGAPASHSSAGAHPPRPRPSNLAYVIYTSGSTGRPKGVAISHASASALVHWALSAYDREELAGVLACTSLSFDLSIFELFAPLAAGGCVILARDLLALPELEGIAEVTLVNTVPSVLEQLLMLTHTLPAGVRTVNLAGEPLPGALVRRLYAIPTIDRVVNLYGPSEDTTYSTCAELDTAVERPPIGRPIEGGRSYVLDRWLKPVPAGSVGELYLAGTGLARGYLGRPGLTAERFLPDPHGPPGERMYYTGDRARVLPSGELEFLGRSDDQVKLRGFRIELGEIEAALRAHPAVGSCAVAMWPEVSGGDRLVAYIVSPDAPAPGDLRAFLAERLPRHMVPAMFVEIPRLPLSPNGKLNREALPRPDAIPRLGQSPRGGTEAIVAACWCEVLGVPWVGRDEPFLELGGHSLLAIQIVARLRRSCGVELQLRDFLLRATVADVASAVEGLRGALGLATEPIRANSESRRELSYAQRRLWVLDRLLPGSSSYNVLNRIRLEGRLDIQALERGFDAVLARHDVLRGRFADRNGVPCQTIAPRLDHGVTIEDLSGLPDERREERRGEVIESLGREPFDLAGDLVRARLLILGEDRHELMLAVHHIVFDGESLPLMVNELAHCYEAFRTGQEPTLPPLAIQYGDYADWQRRRLEGGALAELETFWRSALERAPSVLALPTDRPRTAGGSIGAQLRLPLDEYLAEDLRTFARGRDVTLYTVLLAGFATVLHAYTGEPDLLIGTAVAGRDQIETESLIGNFVNTLVLRTAVGGVRTYAELVTHAHRVLLDALAHREMPFDCLVKAVRPARLPGVSPVVQIAFGLEQDPTSRIELDELIIEAEELFTGETRLDLTAWIYDHGSRLEAVWSYDSALFDRSTITELHERFCTVLRAGADSPDSLVSELATLAAHPGRRVTHLPPWHDTHDLRLPAFGGVS